MSWRSVVKRSMEGLAHAHAGEMLPWEEKCRLLGVEPSGAELVEPLCRTSPLGRSNRRVALLVDASLAGHLIDYVIYTCRCLEAGLTLLTSAPLQAMEPMLRPYLARLAEAGITPQLAQMESAATGGLVAYLHYHQDVIFVVVGSQNQVCRPWYESARSRSRWRLSVPLVVVDEESPLPSHVA